MRSKPVVISKATARLSPTIGFDTDQPNQKWVTDITYLLLVNGFVYLAVVLGLFGRKVVGWELSDSLATPFGIRAMVTFGLTLSF